MSQSTRRTNQSTTVNDHIRELFIRIAVSFVAMAIAGTLVFLFYAPILAFLSSPLGKPLYYSSPAGSFNFVMKICFTGALIIAVPVLAYNLIMFVRPVFKKALTMKRVIATTIGSTVLAVSGALFAFYCVLPGTLKFFSDFQVSGLKALISANSYLGFITNLIIMFVIVFQIPLVIMFIDYIKPLKPSGLVRKSKWIILGSLMVTIIQPFTYDLLTSLLIALPIIALYYLSIVLVVIQHLAVKRSDNNTVLAMVSKPTADNDNEMVLDGLVYETLLDELSRLKKPVPISTLPSGNSVMEFVKPYEQPEIKTPNWVLERKARQRQFSKQVNVFSDIIRKPGISHA